MRIACIGVSHWHTFLYLDPVLTLPGVTVVAVSDVDNGVARSLAERLGCPWFEDYRQLCSKMNPDFAFVLGNHASMAEVCGYLIEVGIPFCVEKPAGSSHLQVAELARAAEAKGLFAAVPFVFRNSDLLNEIKRHTGSDPFHYLGFKFIAGPVSRYESSNSSWMLKRAVAGGGCFLNLGVHFVDLARVLLGDDLDVEAVSMSTMTGSHDVEDHAIVVLASGKARCVIETGYLYPAPPGVFDMHFSFGSRDSYFVARDPLSLEKVDRDGVSTRIDVATTNVPYYAPFTVDLLERFKRGEAPTASLIDMAAVMKIAGDAFNDAGRSL